MTSRTLGLVAALALAGAALAAESEIEETGMRFVVPPEGKLVRILAQPDANSETVDSLPLGARVRYAKKRVEDGAPLWYFTAPPGRKAGWMEAAILAERLPTPPPAKKIIIDPKDATVYQGRAALTSAGRGLDDRAAQYAKRKADKGEASFAKACVQFRTLFKRVSLIMADVPHDGETKDATGKTHPSGQMNETKTADGRLRAGDAFKKELK